MMHVCRNMRILRRRISRGITMRWGTRQRWHDDTLDGGDIVKVVSLEDGRKEESWCHGIENFLVCSIVWGKIKTSSALQLG